MSFLDLDERLIALAERVEICFSPVADIKEFPEDVDMTLVEGAVANEEHLGEILRIRERTRILIAFGDCAVTGNVTAMRNLFPLESVLQCVYAESAAIGGMPPDGKIVPRLLERVLRIQDVVTVDVFLPGCPPSADAILETVEELLNGRAPLPGRRFGL
jgi:NAD-reducing hydrogenase small subunit